MSDALFERRCGFQIVSHCRTSKSVTVPDRQTVARRQRSFETTLLTVTLVAVCHHDLSAVLLLPRSSSDSPFHDPLAETFLY